MPIATNILQTGNANIQPPTTEVRTGHNYFEVFKRVNNQGILVTTPLLGTPNEMFTRLEKIMQL